MKEKLEFIRQKEQMNASELAKKLGVEASAISHIKSGRNKPSFDFVVKILAAFPHINPDWLLLNRGPYSRAEVSDAMPSVNVAADVAREDKLSPAGEVSLFDAAENIASSQSVQSTQNSTELNFPLPQRSGKIVERIIVLYSDKSFESYNPSGR